MHFTLRQLEIFEAVAISGSISLAAQKVSLSQSAVSSALSKLEEQSDARLFNRQGKKLVLNDFGRQLLIRAHSLLEHAKDFQLPPDRELKGALTVGASPTIGHYLLPRICGEFLQEHPGVELDLQVASSLDIVQRVKNLGVDIGVVEGFVNQGTVEATRWLDDRLVFFTSPAHRLARRPEVSIAELADESWCMEPVGAVTRTVVLVSVLAHIGAIDIRFVSPSTEAIKLAVRAGGGIGCLSQISLQEELSRGQLVPIMVKEIQIARVFSIVRHRDTYRGQIHEAFTQMLQLVAA